VRALTVILSDVYGLSEAPRLAAPALEEICRFASLRPLPLGWRPWIAARIGRSDLAPCAPAGVAAALIDAPRTAGAWLATPVHWQATLDHVRMESGAILTVGAAAARELADDFTRVFGGSGLALHPLGDAGWLLVGLGLPAVTTEIESVDPARVLGGDIAPFLPRGPRAEAGALRALGTEIEMWLHAHPLNRARAAAQRPPISALWLWGGGAGLATGLEPAGASAGVRGLAGVHGFGDDPYLQGLWRLNGAQLESAAHAVALPTDPGRLAAMDECVVEFQVFRERGSFEGIAEFDAAWLAPALAAVRRGEIQRLIIAASDRSFELARPDLWKFWRRARVAAGAPA
jgi:hypothetical protein